MLTRRSFLKSLGIASAAAAAGYGAGKLVQAQKTRTFSIHGFLPGDEKTIAEVVSVFSKRVQAGSTPAVFASDEMKNMITRAYGNSVEPSFSNDGKVVFRLSRLSKPVAGDILVSDDKNTVYNPAEDFNGSLIWLRRKLNNSQAQYMFSAEYSEENLFASLFNSGGKTVVIENEKGVFDKIDLKNSYKNIVINGPQGKTGIKLENGSVHVHTATCRHELCKSSGYISQTGSVIACAPNKVLIKIETA